MQFETMILGAAAIALAGMVISLINENKALRKREDHLRRVITDQSNRLVDLELKLHQLKNPDQDPDAALTPCNWKKD